MQPLAEVTIYTDGACVGNPGPGGYAAVLSCRGRVREVTGGRRLTTNNRMELLAVIAGLDVLTRPCRVTVISDARYVVDGIERGWAAGWRAAGRARQPGQYVPNADLWRQLLDLCGRHDVRCEWVRGHAGDAVNARCDRIAKQAARGPDLPADAGYERPAATPALFDTAAGATSATSPAAGGCSGS